MVTDEQVRRLRKLIMKEKTYTTAAAKAGMDEKTARKWRDSRKLPSECRLIRTYRTRSDVFEDVWGEISRMLEINPGLQAKTIFGHLQRRYVGQFADGQLRTLQRKIRVWRAVEGPPKEVFFPQVHEPGKLAQSDFTHMKRLNITICGIPFDHLLYHFVLTYSDWETGTICFSECFEALADGLQSALWELGGVPEAHRTDQLSTAVTNLGSKEEFTTRYQGLIAHYGLEGQKINVARPNENGDVEQRHRRTKEAIDQALMLRGSRDFSSVAQYESFLREIFAQLNAGRQKRFLEEQRALRSLPRRRLDTMVRLAARVGLGSTINVKRNVYSVHSRLIGEMVDVHIHVDHLKVFYAQRLVQTLPRLRGEGKHQIDYRHVIDELVKKPGAFANYRYRADIFPTVNFRLAYDYLSRDKKRGADREYLSILKLAADEGQTKVENILRELIGHKDELSADRIENMLDLDTVPGVAEIEIAPVDLLNYDRLLSLAVV